MATESACKIGPRGVVVVMVEVSVEEVEVSDEVIEDDVVVKVVVDIDVVEVTLVVSKKKKIIIKFLYF